ncbi:M3 family metallopeptidase [Naasia lichenicola]|uniref:M3 family metallopeptidase n=1 Tax=Naasia lichenicola TaxID=2565933 RepID=A0A4S4FG58_9MICO|nr:M3 family metallopeptidase [Naasia lichenicola]THG28674.1 M3 family metallopeptidase [Naasia lichenicola]
MTENPFFSPSSLPFQLPPFAEIRDDHYEPAFERGMAEQIAEVQAILVAPEPATFANTIEALERSGRILKRVSAVFFGLSSSDKTPFIAELEERIAPRLSAHGDRIRLDSDLYERIRAVSERVAAGEEQLDAEAVYLVDRYLTSYTLSGAGLGDADKATLREVNQRLSTLTTRFDTDLLDDTNALAVHVADVSELDGLGADAIATAAANATSRGLEGYLITLVLPTGHPYLASLTNRALRERIMTASQSRAARDNDADNRPVVLEIARLRASRAELLGFRSHAAAVTAAQTAGTPEAVDALLRRLAAPAAANARAEAAVLQEQIDATETDSTLASWDWAFYTEKVRAARFDVDTSAMRPYFDAERVLRDGVFFAATSLYGIRFEERFDLAAYNGEARVFEVTEDDGTPIGLYLLDLYTRDSKHGGAWMNSFVSQSRLLGTPRVVTNNLNVPRPAPGTPTLLTLDEVTTLFHEFGHALHGLFATVTYPRFAGTSVFRDFVEFPSQVNEMWMLWPEVLANYAKHFDTGEPMPQEMVDRLIASRAFNEGFRTSEYLAAALLDQAWHGLSSAEAEAVTDVAEFERAALERVGLADRAVPTRYSSTYFSHVFAGGYDAGYYSYIWSEVLDADTVRWFEENGGMTRANGDRFRRHVLGIGGSRDPLEAYREFRGRDADIAPLLERRGLTES